MDQLLAYVIDKCRDQLVTVDPVKGKDGTRGLSVVSSDKYYFFLPSTATSDAFIVELLKEVKQLACFDLRKIIDWPLTDKPVIDVKSIYGGECNLPQLAAEFSRNHPYPAVARYLSLDQKFVAHSKAAKTVGIEMPTAQIVPKELLEEWVKTRAMTISTLYLSYRSRDNNSRDNLSNYENRWRFIRSLRQVELNGTKVNETYIKEALQSVTEPAAAKCLRSMDGLSKDGFVTSLFNPMGSKTGRVRLEGGFNVLGIPHGPAREAIVSRFDNGKIYTFDFNAIDYRCIVSSIGGDFARLYADVDDFHARTAAFLFKDVTKVRRDIMKYISYVYIYGGSVETLMEKTGLERQLVEVALQKLDENIRPIAEFRERLLMRAKNDGFVDVPGGQRIYVTSDDHAGKVLGLYAQSFSSFVFEQAFVKVQEFLVSKRSCVIFPVHDELVIDVHPDEEEEIAPEVKRLMETAVGNYKVNVKKGGTYGSVV